MAEQKQLWKVGPAHDTHGRGRPVPQNPDYLRGVWTLAGDWVCDCTDEFTARMMVEGHNISDAPGDRNGGTNG
jgi:hypothetical protein